MRDTDIVAAARSIQAERPDLVHDGPALDALLRRAEQGERVGDDILDLFAVTPPAREELRRRLPQEPDTSRSADTTGYAGLPGYGDPTDAIVYRCSMCGYEYPVFEIGEPVPDGCPRGHGPLVQAG
jgi:hypothetical protein